jgi:SET domain-containing protein
MMDLIPKKSNIHGYGIFTQRDIKKGESFNQTLLSKLPKEEHSNIISTHHYGQTINGIYTRFLILGPPHFYNHSENPNTEIKLKKTTEDFYYLESSSLVDINKGDEITILYNKCIKS